MEKDSIMKVKLSFHFNFSVVITSLESEKFPNHVPDLFHFPVSYYWSRSTKHFSLILISVLISLPQTWSKVAYSGHVSPKPDQ